MERQWLLPYPLLNGYAAIQLESKSFGNRQLFVREKELRWEAFRNYIKSYFTFGRGRLCPNRELQTTNKITVD
jgi:hypothetical protein